MDLPNWGAQRSGKSTSQAGAKTLGRLEIEAAERVVRRERTNRSARFYVGSRSERGAIAPGGGSAVVIDDDGQVALPLAMGDLVDPDPAQPVEQSTSRCASATTRSQIPPTVRHATRISAATAVFVVLTASHAA